MAIACDTCSIAPVARVQNSPFFQRDFEPYRCIRCTPEVSHEEVTVNNGRHLGKSLVGAIIDTLTTLSDNVGPVHEQCKNRFVMDHKGGAFWVPNRVIVFSMEVGAKRGY